MTEVAVRCTKCALACVNGCTKKTRKTRARQTHTDLKGDRGDLHKSKRRKTMVGDAHRAKIAQLEAQCELYRNKIDVIEKEIAHVQD